MRRIFITSKGKRRMILLVLRDGIERTGTALADAANLPSGSIYPELARLERERLIESRWKGANYPRRRMYRITHKGLRALWEAPGG